MSLKAPVLPGAECRRRRLPDRGAGRWKELKPGRKRLLGPTCCDLLWAQAGASFGEVGLCVFSTSRRLGEVHCDGGWRARRVSETDLYASSGVTGEGSGAGRYCLRARAAGEG